MPLAIEDHFVKLYEDDEELATPWSTYYLATRYEHDRRVCTINKRDGRLCRLIGNWAMVDYLTARRNEQVMAVLADEEDGQEMPRQTTKRQRQASLDERPRFIGITVNDVTVHVMTAASARDKLVVEYTADTIKVLATQPPPMPCSFPYIDDPDIAWHLGTHSLVAW